MDGGGGPGPAAARRAQDRREELQRNFSRALAGEPLQSFETRRIRKDGTPIDVSLWVAPLPSPEGMRILGIVDDITERQRLVAERGRRVEELAAADQRKDEFLAMLAPP